MILCDSGPLIAAAIEDDDDYAACVDLLTGLRLAQRRLLVPATVVAEVGYMIESLGDPSREALFLRAVAQGDFFSAQSPKATFKPSNSRQLTTRGWPNS